MVLNFYFLLEKVDKILLKNLKFVKSKKNQIFFYNSQYLLNNNKLKRNK